MIKDKTFKYFLIYKTTNQVNGKIYIGAHATNNLVDSYLGSGKILKAAIKKYGRKNFTKEILHECSDLKSMYEKEAELVNKAFIENGASYNLFCGGSGLSHPTKEQRIEMSKQRKGKPHTAEWSKRISESLKGHSVSEERKQAISKKLKGIPLSESTKRKMSQAQKKRTIPADVRKKISETLKGHKHSPESLLKMSNTLKGRKLSEEHKNKIRLQSTGRKHTPETCKRLSECNKGNTNRLGNKVSDTTKQKISQANKGKIVSTETRQKLSEINKGKHHTKETCDKISASMKGIRKSDETRRKISKTEQKNKLAKP